jgi:uncharacterized protein YdhG (YjbR/CyaY superfamily)
LQRFTKPPTARSRGFESRPLRTIVYPVLSMISPTIDTYIQTYPKTVQIRLRAIRKTILSVIPGGVERISYGIPTVDLFGKHVVHFAAFTRHIGFFPTPSAIAVFRKELADYKTAKGTIQFPLDVPLPHDLIKKITMYRVREITTKQSGRR